MLRSLVVRARDTAQVPCWGLCQIGEIGAPNTLVLVSSPQLWFTFLRCNCVAVNGAAV